MSYHKAIKLDLRRNRIKDALDKMEALIEASGDDYYSNSLTQLFARYHANKQSFDGGMRIQQDYDIENARIRHAITSFVDDIPDVAYPGEAEDEQASSPPPVHIPPKRPGRSDPTSNDPTSGSPTTENPQQEEANIRILMLTSNPSDTAKLNLDREHSHIQDELSKSEYYDDFQLFRQRESTVLHLGRTMIAHKPQIVHFSGHGQRAKAGGTGNNPFGERQPGQEGGLMFKQVEGHETQLVGATTLKALFSSMKHIQKIPVRVVVLNACHAQEQAQAIASEIDFVIGTNDEISDQAAWTFSVGFYFMLVSEPDRELDDDLIRRAFNMGQLNALTMGEPLQRFKLYIRGELQD